MSVLAYKRKESKLEFYNTALKVVDTVWFLCIRDFGLKPRARTPTFYTRGWSEEDKNLFETLIRDHGIAKVIDIYPNWVIQKLRDEMLYLAFDMVQNITNAYTVWATTLAEFDLRRTSQDKAIADCYGLLQRLQFITKVLPIHADKLKHIVEIINKEIRLLKGWRKSDNKRRKEFEQKG